MGRLDSRRIMVVEDEYYLADDVSRALKREGARVIGPFGDQHEAVGAIEEGRLDGAILDVNLGEGVSFDLADVLRTHDVPFLFFTGYDQDVIPERFSDVARLEKPVGDGLLVQAVVELCTRSP